MAWVKVGQLQKGKIFTVYSGETFDLKWYSDNINWENPIVVGQVSSMFFDRFHTAGFKANIIHQGGTVYRAEALSNGIVSTTISFVEWFNSVIYNKNPFVDGGSSLNNGEAHSKGHIGNFRGMGLAFWLEPGKYNYYNSYGDVVVRIANHELYRRSINRNGNHITSFLYTPYFSGHVVVSFENANISPLWYNFKPQLSNWEIKSGILTIYANESFGVNY